MRAEPVVPRASQVDDRGDEYRYDEELEVNVLVSDSSVVAVSRPEFVQKTTQMTGGED
jgi:hypothetical protein